jgi:HPt (histidine-containing phosphotransfer) domain-containing protein
VEIPPPRPFARLGGAIVGVTMLRALGTLLPTGAAHWVDVAGSCVTWGAVGVAVVWGGRALFDLQRVVLEQCSRAEQRAQQQAPAAPILSPPLPPPDLFAVVRTIEAPAAVTSPADAVTVRPQRLAAVPPAVVGVAISRESVVREAPERLKELQQALSRADYQRMASLALTLKVNAAEANAPLLAQGAARIEALLRDNAESRQLAVGLVGLSHLIDALSRSARTTSMGPPPSLHASQRLVQSGVRRQAKGVGS